MSYNLISQTIDLGDGKPVTIESGKLAKQADGSVVVKQGNTMILATVVANKEAKEGTDFLPLSVDYQEKFASVGRIPGGFLRREGRLSDYEILISRIVDRAIRPLFPEDYHADVQVALYLISSDQNIAPDSLVGLAASAALSLTDIPFNGPISEVRVAKIDGKLVINPYKDEMERATIDMIVAGNYKDINMVEGEMAEVSEEEMLEALKFAHEAIKKQIEGILALVEKNGGKKPFRTYQHENNNEELRESIKSFAFDKVYEIAKRGTSKQERTEALEKVFEDFKATLSPEVLDANGSLLKRYYGEVKYYAVREMVLNERKRLDGRKLNEIRPIWSEVNYLPSAHGSAVFTRGETQSLTSVTLGTKLDEQMLDSPMNSGYNRFMLHYNFPAFSTGEVKPNRGPGRREIGHGNLAMRSVRRVLPNDMDNPYTIRIVSDILESNGSSSMATVCASSLALMDAGIKVSNAVSGIAMGMISNEKNYAVLSDILGDEDHLGDMDFKVTGTKNGIVGCQMDIKVEGLSYEVLYEALLQAKEGRLHILNEMNKTISAPNQDYKPHAPRIEKLLIDGDQIGAVIGPGGKVIQGIQKETGAIISITEEGNKGIVEIASANAQSLNDAKKRILAITTKVEEGQVFDGIVKSLLPFGAIVEILPGKEGLLHISELMHKRVETMEGVLQVGEEIKVKVLETDGRGKIKLSRKALLPKPERSNEPRPERKHEDRPARKDDKPE